MAAQNAGHEAGNTEITPDHLLLGVLSDSTALATPLLLAQNVTAEAVRGTIALPPPGDNPPALIPFSPAAGAALEATFSEALRLGHNYIGTEHILLALLDAEDGSGPLHRAGVDKQRLEFDLAAMLAAVSSKPSP